MPRGKSSRYGSLSGEDIGEKTTIADIHAERLGDMVKAVLAIGDAVLIATTKDGGSVRVILMSGDDKTSTYLTSGTAVNEFCMRVRDMALDIGS